MGRWGEFSGALAEDLTGQERARRETLGFGPKRYVILSLGADKAWRPLGPVTQGELIKNTGSHMPEGTVQNLVPGKVLKSLFYFSHKEV